MRNLFLLILVLQFSLHSKAQPEFDRAELCSIGALNAVKKAHQMTDLPIHPVSILYAHKNKTYQAGEKATGVIYSSTKEINTSVGQDVSFHTFMTALRNPRSVLYTERIDSLPYHGKNSKGYYGTVCSGLVTYALGFKVTQRSADIPVANYMELVQDQSAKGARIADVVWSKGHVQLVTGIEKDKMGNIIRIEICESVNPGCRRLYMDEQSFNEMLHFKKKVKRLYRYKDLWKNTTYTPLPEFSNNDKICVSKGDKACYIVGENVILNIFGEGDKVEIYKDSKLFKEIAIHDKDANVLLKKYPFGDYQARVVTGKKKSDFTKWKIVDVDVRIDKEKKRIYFKSANATPVYYEFCSITGGRPTNKNRIYAAEFTEDDINNGFVDVLPPKKPAKGQREYTYVKVHFGCDYGMVINKLINWYK